MPKKILQNHAPKISNFDGAVAYKNLREKVTARGILERSYGYYFALISLVLGGYALSIYMLIVQNSALALIFWSVLFSMLAVQIAGLVHDSGHRAIFKSVWANDLFGKFASSFIAMRYESWRTKHNEHHAHPNQEDEDPDFALPFLAFTEDEFKRKKGIGKLLRKYQVYMYFPIGLFVIFTTRFRSIREFITDFKVKELWELAIFTAVFVTWFILPFVFFPLGKALIIFAVVNGVTGFYLFNIFAPNHKGMPKLAKNVKISFLEQQIMTSRDIESNWFTDFIYLGLNNQIEHHLFPNCPRNKLHLLIPHVRKAASEAGVGYTSVGIIHTNKLILHELKEVASVSS
jgi:fatty acid desaturase